MCLDSQGNVLEDVAVDGKMAIDYSDQVLDEQFEFYNLTRGQMIKSVQVVNGQRDAKDGGPVVLMTTAEGKVIDLAKLDRFSQSAYANFL